MGGGDCAVIRVTKETKDLVKPWLQHEDMKTNSGLFQRQMLATKVKLFAAVWGTHTEDIPLQGYGRMQQQHGGGDWRSF